MYLVALNTVDEVEQMITSTSYMMIRWNDSFMTWTPSDYGGIGSFEIPQNAIWKPDLALANAYDTIKGLGDAFMYLTITSAGTISWRPYQVFHSSCSIDMTYFPFDTQICDIQLVTWSSTKTMINIAPGSVGITTQFYETNANWDLVDVSTVDSSDDSTAGLSFRLKIKRKPLYYMINLIIPMVLLSVLNIFVFALPCDSGQKSGYAKVLFLSFVIFLLIVTNIMPEGMSTVPVMSIYLLFQCVLSTIVVLIVIIQLRLHNLKDTPIPAFFLTLVRVMQKVKKTILCENNTGKGKQKSFARECNSPPPNYEDIDNNTLNEEDQLVRRRETHSPNESEEGESPACYPCRKNKKFGEDIEMITTMKSLSTSSNKTVRRLSDALAPKNRLMPLTSVRVMYKRSSIEDTYNIMDARPVSAATNTPIGVGLREEGTPPVMVGSPIFMTELMAQLHRRSVPNQSFYSLF